jgi:hypothetical protein
MATVFAQVNSNPIGSGQFCEDGGRNGIRFYRSSCLPNGGDVVNIYAESRQFLFSKGSILILVEMPS